MSRKYEGDRWSSDVRRRDSEWAATREQVNSEVARTLEVRHGLSFSAEHARSVKNGFGSRVNKFVQIT